MTNSDAPAATSERYSDRPVIRIAVCGEVRSGKSSLLNALFCDNILPDNLGKDSSPTIFAEYNPEPAIEFIQADGNVIEVSDIAKADASSDVTSIQILHDKAHLANFEFVEIQTANAESLTRNQIDLVRSSDVLIWVTIASQAWRLTEKTIVEELGDAKPKHCILAVSRADKLRSRSDRKKIEARVSRETSDSFESLVFMNNSRRLIKNSDAQNVANAKTGAAELVAALSEISVDLHEEALSREAQETGSANPVVQVAQEPAADAQVIAPNGVSVAGADLAAHVMPFVQDIDGEVFVGLINGENTGDSEVILGETEYCNKVGQTCRSLRQSFLETYGCDGAAGSDFGIALKTKTHNLLFHKAIDDVSLFMLSDVATMNHGIAQNKLSQMCKEISRAG